MATDSKNLKLCRVTSNVKTAFDASTPASGSVYWDETEKTLRVGDGETAGGVAFKNGDSINEIIESINETGGGYHPIDIVSGVGTSECVWTNRYRGKISTYGKATVQTVAFDAYHNRLFMLQEAWRLYSDSAQTNEWGRLTHISSVPLYAWGAENAYSEDGTLDPVGKTQTITPDSFFSKISGNVKYLGHQGLAYEALKGGDFRLWTSVQNELAGRTVTIDGVSTTFSAQDGGWVVRFSYPTADGGDITNVQFYHLIEDSKMTDNSPTPTISYDQRYLLVRHNNGNVRDSDGLTREFIRVFDLQMLRDGGPGDYTDKYLTEFEVQTYRDIYDKTGTITSTTKSLAGFCCDGKYVYCMASGTTLGTVRALYCYTLGGVKVSENRYCDIEYADVKSIYNSAHEITSDTDTTVFYSEAEGVCMIPVNGHLTLMYLTNTPQEASYDSSTATYSYSGRNVKLYAVGFKSGYSHLTEPNIDDLDAESITVDNLDAQSITVYGIEIRSSHIIHLETATNAYLMVEGGTSSSDGATLILSGSTRSSHAGGFELRTNNSSGTSVSMIGLPDGTLKWNGQTIQTSSDERLKTSIGSVPDDILDAWGDVSWYQYQFIAAVEAKGEETARLHNGVVAQRIVSVFGEHGLDATRYGLVCHDVWDASDAEYDDEGNLLEPAKEAGDRWTVRYSEALAMEAAYQRRRADRIEARLTALERKLDNGSSTAEEVANADFSD